MTTIPAKKLTLRHIQQSYQEGSPIVALALYDAVMAQIADEVGIPLLLVGDSMGMTILGYETTLPVTLEESLIHTAAVVRGVRRALVIGDMPFLTYRLGKKQTLKNAGRYLQEVGADGVKLEGGKKIASTVSRLVDSGIPVLGHIGLLPQQVAVKGGYRIHGGNKKEADALCEDALALQEAGVFALVVESVPDSLGKKITELLDIPTIGIGAGTTCSGQIQVVHDILGLFEKWLPRHAKRYAHLAKEIRSAFSCYKTDVSEHTFPE